MAYVPQEAISLSPSSKDQATRIAALRCPPALQSLSQGRRQSASSVPAYPYDHAKLKFNPYLSSPPPLSTATLATSLWPAQSSSESFTGPTSANRNPYSNGKGSTHANPGSAAIPSKLVGTGIGSYFSARHQQLPQQSRHHVKLSDSSSSD